MTVQKCHTKVKLWESSLDIDNGKMIQAYVEVKVFDFNQADNLAVVPACPCGHQSGLQHVLAII